MKLALLLLACSGCTEIIVEQAPQDGGIHGVLEQANDASTLPGQDAAKDASWVIVEAGQSMDAAIVDAGSDVQRGDSGTCVLDPHWNSSCLPGTVAYFCSTYVDEAGFYAAAPCPSSSGPAPWVVCCAPDGG